MPASGPHSCAGQPKKAGSPDFSNSSALPNIIIMYADDLGYGDVGCYGATAIPTPNIDRLAREGLQFTNGYAAASTCTPSRYSLLTGSYPWRNERARILPADAPLLITPGTVTLPSMLQEAGYTTAVVGKWHLGLGDGKIDWNGELQHTPLDIGFDYAFIMPATNDRVPCVYIENRRVVGLDPADPPLEVTYDQNQPFPGVPTGKDHPELLKMKYSHGHDMTIVNGVSRIGYMRGGTSAWWKDEEMAEVLLDKAISFVSEQRDRHQPFFLYYAFHQPHVPRLPGPRFAGATKLGPRGDVIAELDWCVGEMLNALDRLGLAENTIVIFSSDNGPVLDDGYVDGAVELCGDHRPAGPMRGGKYSLLDGGTRVPFILRWPQRVAPGRRSSALVCHTDFLASFAALTGMLPHLPPEAAPDSCQVLPALLGETETGRRELVTEDTAARTLLRQDNWVYIPPYPGPAVRRHTNIETGYLSEPQLYNLDADIGQQRNLAAAYPQKVKEMAERLETILAGERTRDGDAC
ncbi:MAG TPA: arylsulfatase [Firmicutes bacterium]|nr:arylsulfatase [Bacillota bacterium]